MEASELTSLLARFHIKPTKRLGQNFLLSEKVLEQIIQAAELGPDDKVLEIGPGLGILTKRLAQEAGEVIAIEKDRKLAKALRKITGKHKNVEILYGDAMSIDPAVILDPGGRRPIGDRISRDPIGRAPEAHSLQDDTYGTYKLVANIPYYLTSKILQKFLSSSSVSLRGAERRSNLDEIATQPAAARNDKVARPSLMVLLLQKEVAERITAKPGQMSILAVSVQFYADPEIIDDVGKENFYPPPEVDSAIVRLKILPKPRLEVDEKKFFQLVKIGFKNKRKQLQNNLRSFYPPPSIPPTRGGKAQKRKFLPPSWGREGGGEEGQRVDYKQLLQSLGLNPLARAQDLSLADWGGLYRRLSLPKAWGGMKGEV